MEIENPSACPMGLHGVAAADMNAALWLASTAGSIKNKLCVFYVHNRSFAKIFLFLPRLTSISSHNRDFLNFCFSCSFFCVFEQIYRLPFAIVLIGCNKNFCSGVQ